MKHISAQRYFCGSCKKLFRAEGSNHKVCDSFAIAVIMGDPASLPAVPPEPAKASWRTWHGPSRRWEDSDFVSCFLVVALMPLKILVSCHDTFDVQGRTCDALWGCQQWQCCSQVVKGQLNAAFPWQSLCVLQQFLKSWAKQGWYKSPEELRVESHSWSAFVHRPVSLLLLCIDLAMLKNTWVFLLFCNSLSFAIA